MSADVQDCFMFTHTSGWFNHRSIITLYIDRLSHLTAFVKKEVVQLITALDTFDLIFAGTVGRHGILNK